MEEKEFVDLSKHDMAEIEAIMYHGLSECLTEGNFDFENKDLQEKAEKVAKTFNEFYLTIRELGYSLDDFIC